MGELITGRFPGNPDRGQPARKKPKPMGAWRFSVVASALSGRYRHILAYFENGCFPLCPAGERVAGWHMAGLGNGPPTCQACLAYAVSFGELMARYRTSFPEACRTCKGQRFTFRGVGPVTAARACQDCQASGRQGGWLTGQDDWKGWRG